MAYSGQFLLLIALSTASKNSRQCVVWLVISPQFCRRCCSLHTLKQRAKVCLVDEWYLESRELLVLYLWISSNCLHGRTEWCLGYQEITSYDFSAWEVINNKVLNSNCVKYWPFKAINIKRFLLFDKFATVHVKLLPVFGVTSGRMWISSNGAHVSNVDS